jgi:hypothetical protein
MSVEAREVIIRTTVSQEGNSAQKPSGKDEKSSTEEIVKACVEKVMQIIRNRNGR